MLHHCVGVDTPTNLLKLERIYEYLVSFLIGLS